MRSLLMIAALLSASYIPPDHDFARQPTVCSLCGADFWKAKDDPLLRSGERYYHSQDRCKREQKRQEIEALRQIAVEKEKKRDE